MDVYSIVEAYMKKVLTGIEGMKILLVDEETSGIISLVMSQSRLFEFDVFLVDYLGSGEREKQKNLTCVVLTRPTAGNIEAIADELKDPKYAKYHLCKKEETLNYTNSTVFTNAVKHAQLERIAEADSHELEMFCDYFPLHNSLVSMNQETLALWSGSGDKLNRFTEGVSSLFYSLKRRPIIRYSDKSTHSSLFAKEINNLFDMNCDYFSSHASIDERPLLLILDRQDDPITPLLTQWTYQAMLHEFFAIRNGRLRLETPTMNQEYVMSLEGDSFYAANLFIPIWQVAEGVQQLVLKYQKMSEMTSSQSTSIVDMKRFMEDYPEYKRLGVHVNKHVTLASELMKLAESLNLRSVSEFEQELVNQSDWTPETAWSKLVPFLHPHASNLSRYHKLRLCMLVLAQVGIHLPLDSLSRLYGFSDDDVDFLKYFYLTRSEKDHVSQSGDNESGTGSFGALKKGIMGFLGNGTLSSEIKAQMTPLTRHIPRMMESIDQLVKDKLSERSHPYLASDYESVKVERPKDIVIVSIDGCTYEEARFVALCNQIYPGVRVTLCSNFVHNSRSYIAEMVSEWQYHHRKQASDQ